MCGIFLYFGDKMINSIYSGYSNIVHRGPDNSSIQLLEIPGLSNNLVIGFHRLKINDVSNAGNQPFSPSEFHGTHLICNGEIYNFKELKKTFKLKTVSNSDCEVIPYLYHECGIMKTLSLLDGVFSFVLVDRDILYIARDPIGIRPLFWGKNNNDEIMFSSECKSLIGFCNEIKPFPPGCLCTINLNDCRMNFERYYHYIYPVIYDRFDNTKNNIRYLLTESVRKRLISDRKIGVFISGGVDSSIIAGLVKNILKDNQIESFTIGLENSPDLENARIVANHLNTTHHEVNFTVEEGIKHLNDVIYHLESYDITTIRASVPQYILSKYIKEKTEIRVVLSGEGADELFGGYLYFHYSPDQNSFIKETERLVKMLYQFDVLRTDRTTAAHGLEVRVPFLDKRFVNYILSLPADYRMPSSEVYSNEGKNQKHLNIEKYILRDSFSDENIIPENILWRKKDAFSDAVGYSWVDGIKKYAESIVSDDELIDAQNKYPNNTPMTKEAYLYRSRFEEMFADNSSLIEHYWMPNWVSESINDPSATYLNAHGFRNSEKS
jgi:asparagine synthase (glutamine-hydrolysing)